MEEKVILTIVSLPRSQFAAPAMIRLRRLLKCMLRSFGFRCVRIEPTTARNAVTGTEEEAA